MGIVHSGHGPEMLDPAAGSSSGTGAYTTGRTEPGRVSPAGAAAEEPGHARRCRTIARAWRHHDHDDRHAPAVRARRQASDSEGPAPRRGSGTGQPPAPWARRSQLAILGPGSPSSRSSPCSRASSRPTPRPTSTSTRGSSCARSSRCGTRRRPRDRHPRVHRLPAADGAVLLAVLGPPRPALGGPAALARHHPLRRRGRRPLPVPHARAARARARSWRRWPSCSRPTSSSTPGGSRSSCCPGPALPWMVAFAALAAAPRRLALPGALRPGRGAGQRDQRQLDPLRRAWPRSSGCSTPSLVEREAALGRRGVGRRRARSPA